MAFLILFTIVLSCFSCVQLSETLWTVWTLWTVAHQAPLPMGFSRQEYWSGLLAISYSRGNA